MVFALYGPYKTLYSIHARCLRNWVTIQQRAVQAVSIIQLPEIFMKMRWQVLQSNLSEQQMMEVHQKTVLGCKRKRVASPPGTLLFEVRSKHTLRISMCSHLSSPQ